MTETQRVVTINGIKGVVLADTDDWIVIERTDEKGGVERFTHNKHTVNIFDDVPVVDDLAGIDVEPVSLTEDAAAEVAVLDALPDLDTVAPKRGAK